MTKEEVIGKIREVGIVPVVRARSLRIARLAVDAVCAGELPIVEITMTVPDATEVIRQVVRENDAAVLTGAGTVTTAEQARACIDAGAQFLVSPGLSAEVLGVAASHGVLAIPGVLTPTEVMAALALGVNLVKVFPSGNVGGPRYIKALRGPFPKLQMIPTGGVTLANAREFIESGALALGVGSELIDEAALLKGKGALVTERARQFVEAVRHSRDQFKRMVI
jgi:2-dehydro-3-deoxyphosphogluconate aldolase/(4S)-4-hydroxy-2-oxoglutarate aldolase